MKIYIPESERKIIRHNIKIQDDITVTIDGCPDWGTEIVYQHRDVAVVPDKKGRAYWHIGEWKSYYAQ